jgi:hypothetical protein
MNQPSSARFSFYGLGIEVRCRDPLTLRGIQGDYAFFSNDASAPAVFIEILPEPPDYKNLPSVKAYLYTPRNICYRYKGLSFIDYFGKGLSIIDYHKNTYKVFCADEHLRQEIAFLTILSLIGQYLDAQHLHRVHGLGLEINNKGVFVLLPSGGGKTTLLLELLKNDFIKLLSEDSPLIDTKGRALPFPLRIGVSYEDKPKDIPDEHLHFIQRMEFAPKYTVALDYFKDKISDKTPLVRYILCGRRCLGEESYIKPLSKYGTLKEMINNSVVGVGLYQGIEFLMQRGVFELFKKSGLLFSRFRNAAEVVSAAKTYSFVIGCDRRKNAETFLRFCKEQILPV